MFDAGSSALPVPSYLSDYIQPTFAHGLRIWWAFFWPTMLISAILGAAINFGLRVIYEHTNVPGNLIGPIMRFSPYVISYIVALFIMEYILRKSFRHFRLGLARSGANTNVQALPATFARTVRVWWTYSWRTVLYRFIITFVATIPLSVLLGIFTRVPAAQAVVRMLVMIAIDAGAGLFVIYSNILDEDFGDFRVCLLPLQKDASASAAPVPNAAAI
jgi:uncharacterized membrane protein YphA (DoxX/SURF4 family)